MKSTGIVRNIDELGRIVLPKELRRTLDIKTKDPIEIFVDDNLILLRPYEAHSTCAVTGVVSEDNVKFGNIVLSKEGAEDLAERIKSASFE